MPQTTATPSAPRIPDADRSLAASGSEAAVTARSGRRRALRRKLAIGAVAGLAALMAFACADDGDVVTIDTAVDPDLVDALDTDDDGVVSRDAVGDAVEAAELEAQLESERAERDAARAAQEAAFGALLSDGAAVAASFPGGQVLVHDVRKNIVDSPVTLMDDPENPTHEEFVSRLTSMIQLRLAGVALDGLDFPVDVSASDEEINAQVQAHLEGAFEEFAQQRSVEEDPSIERLATPHCVSALAVTTEADANSASDRVRAGEALPDVAAAVNLPGLAGADGTIGCGQPFSLFGGGDLALALLDLKPGGLTEPLMLPSAASPTGELWVVLHLDALLSDETDLSSIGPFAGHVLTEIMSIYEVSVAPGLGAWNADSLRVSLPILP
ncbi:hypothetical protein [Candidatus Poriferisodalis sp.]|uniref:hypothetical protein n=1 Tax=Candidatus Poriferisodalis sp. TaxID=3101277 RepID=UPI003B5BFB3F